MSLFSGWETKDVLAAGAASRAQSGFVFLQKILSPHSFLRQSATSAPHSRQISILISHNFELLLDAGVLMCSSAQNEQALIEELKCNHRLDVLWKKVTNTDTKLLLGINRIDPRKRNIFYYFEVELADGTVLIVDEFKNIRYDISDFRGKESSALRQVKREGEGLILTVQRLSDISTNTLKSVYAKYSQ